MSSGYRVYFGLRTEASIFEADVPGADDDGVPISIAAKTNRLAPAGPRGECLFCYFGLTFNWTGGPHIITVTPIIDETVGELAPTANAGGLLLAQSVLLTDAATARIVSTFEVPILEVYRSGNVERLRNHPRGRWIQAQIAFDADASVILDSCDVEYEVVREQQQPVS